MGRTVPTYRLHTESIINEWMDYRRALREKDREVFDELMYKARLHSSAGSYTAHLDPVATMFLSILLELQKEIRDAKDIRMNMHTQNDGEEHRGGAGRVRDALRGEEGGGEL